MPWTAALALLAGGLILLAVGLRVHWYSPTRIVAHLAMRGRGLYFSRTPDGDWWRLRLRPRCPSPGGWPAPEDPPPAGVREPRRPHGPTPRSTAAGR